VIEVVKFRLNGDVGTEEFLERNADFQQHFIYQQDGVQRRTVASGLEGECSISAASTSSVAAAFTSMLDPASIETDYFKELPG
jgi:hypothetical protein